VKGISTKECLLIFIVTFFLVVLYRLFYGGLEWKPILGLTIVLYIYYGALETIMEQIKENNWWKDDREG